MFLLGRVHVVPNLLTHWWLADQLYAWQGGRWSAQSHWLTEGILHNGARWMVGVAWLSIVTAWVATMLRSGWCALRKPLGYLALVIVLSTGLVSALKSFSDMHCPWDLGRYGGIGVHHGILQARSGAPGHCFPAGHASGGYAWMALYFFFIAVKPEWRRRGLGIGIGLGLLFGIDQQVRGAHLLSHDLVTAMICWSIALGLDWLIMRPSGTEGAT